MKVDLHMDCDNDAFEEYPATEIASILRDAARRIEDDGVFDLKLRDINGNIVGYLRVTA